MNPPARYVALTASNAFRTSAFLALRSSWTAPSLIFRDTDMKNGIPFTCIRSKHRVTSLSRIRSSGGSRLLWMRTFGGACLTVLPFRLPVSGPKIVSAFTMSAVVTGQFGSWFRVTNRMKSLVDGRPITFWMKRAFSARETSSLVNLDLFSAIVLTIATPVSPVLVVTQW